MSDTRLARLHALAKLVNEREMARTARLAGARAETRARLDALAAPLPLATDPALIHARQAHLAWATAQRMQLNQRLAREMAALIEQRRRTARSLGRVAVLGRLRDATR